MSVRVPSPSSTSRANQPLDAMHQSAFFGPERSNVSSISVHGTMACTKAAVCAFWMDLCWQCVGAPALVNASCLAHHNVERPATVRRAEKSGEDRLHIG